MAIALHKRNLSCSGPAGMATELDPRTSASASSRLRDTLVLRLPKSLSEPLPHGDVVRHRDGFRPFPRLGGCLGLLLGPSLRALPLRPVGQGGSKIQTELLL